MRYEFTLTRIVNLEKEIQAIKDKINSHVGIVPVSFYDELDRLELQLIKSNQKG